MIIAGIYLIIDAAGSLIKFRRQPTIYQLIRVGRGLIGLALILYPII